MSDLILVISSEFYGAMSNQLKNWPRWGEWYMGEKRETLQEFLDKHLENMVYDEQHHIIHEVTRVDYEAFCPYTMAEHADHPKTCKECGKILDNDLVLKTAEELNELHRKKKWKYGKFRPWWICPDCWEPWG